MKKILLLLAIVISLKGSAQTLDTVSVGASYANQVWYSLENDVQSVHPQNSWDLAFQINGFSASILLNASLGAQLYLYPNGDTASWSTLDTAGINSWTAAYNSTKSWSEGAFNRGVDTSNAFDLGWGQYNFITHQVTGDSLFVWKSANGAIKKIWIERLASGTYYFKVADLNGSNLNQVALAKSNFQGKTFGYYNISQNIILDLEPASSAWDLVFSKYISLIPISSTAFLPYSVSGIRHHENIEVAQVYPVNNPSTYNTYKSASYSSDIDVIGSDWKAFDFSLGYVIEDSTVYFVKRDTIFWKLVMQDFGGSANGNYVFTKEKMSQTTSLIKHNKEVGSFLIYPNPATQRNISLVTDFKNNAKVELRVVNVSGQVVMHKQLQTTGSLQTHYLEFSQLKAGMYIIRLDHPEGSLNQRMILK